MILFLLSCSSHPMAQLPPPISLDVEEVFTAAPFRMSVATGLADTRVVFVASRAAPEPGACPPVLGGACLGLIQSLVVADVRADAAGVATHTVSVPDLHELRQWPPSVYFQAVALRSDGVVMTAPVERQILTGHQDLDADGLTNATERRAGLDARAPDTDGGGVLDGQEWVHGSDPLDPADDEGREVACTNHLDDDQDGVWDGADSDCPATDEDCTLPGDEDLDGRPDCADLDCAAACPDCLPACGEDCSDGEDDDGDALTDCEDPDCADTCAVWCGPSPGDGRADTRDEARPTLDCWYNEMELCTNGIDDDGDRLLDCEDVECAPCHRELCFDGVDNDGNRRVDCQDGDCLDRCVELCHNRVDDDLDLLADCLDPDCACHEACANGADDDRDGLADCADPECGCAETCGNGIDDDHDGLIDCEESSCHDLCLETCDNGFDDNSDGWVDCQDSDCWTSASCPAASTLAWVRAGVMRAQEAWTYGASPCSSRAFHSVSVNVIDVEGVVRVDHAGRWDTCTWRLDMARFHDSGYPDRSCRFFGHGPYAGTHRYGLRIEPECGLDGAGFLPRLAPAIEPLLSARMDVVRGTPWYGGDVETWYEHNGLTPRGSVRDVVIALVPVVETVGVFGTCTTGTPTLISEPLAVWDRVGVCAP